jgi:LPXTG-motif cell wall-anchored protein
MSEEFSDDFVVENEEESNRPFLVSAGLLIGIFIVISAALLGVLLSRQGSATSAEAQSIEATNEAIMATNTSIEATNDALAMVPEEEPATEEPTDEPAEIVPTNTPEPVPTREVAVEAEATAAPTETAVPETTPTEVVEGEPTEEPEEMATPTTVAVAPEGELPQTGLDIGSMLLAVFGLIGLLFVARRLRSV